MLLLRSLSSSGFLGDGIVQRKTGADTLEVVDTVARSSDQLPHSDNVHTGFLLGIWVFHKDDFRISLQIGNFRQFDKVIDAAAVEFQVEASILEGAGKLDN